MSPDSDRQSRRLKYIVSRGKKTEFSFICRITNSDLKCILCIQDCERDPESKAGAAAEQLSKCKASLAEFETTVKNMDPLKFANAMKVEAELKGGDELQLMALGLFDV